MFRIGIELVRSAPEAKPMANRRLLSRRRFLESAAIGAGAAALSRHAALAQPFAAAAFPNPVPSGIDHVVVAMMENRSFDHLLGWLAGADGMQGGPSHVRRRRGAPAPLPHPP